MSDIPLPAGHQWGDGLAQWVWKHDPMQSIPIETIEPRCFPLVEVFPGIYISSDRIVSLEVLNKDTMSFVKVVWNETPNQCAAHEWDFPNQDEAEKHVAKIVRSINFLRMPPGTVVNPHANQDQ